MSPETDIWDISWLPFKPVLRLPGLIVVRCHHPAARLWLVMIFGFLVLAWLPRVAWWRLRLLRLGKS